MRLNTGGIIAMSFTDDKKGKGKMLRIRSREVAAFTNQQLLECVRNRQIDHKLLVNDRDGSLKFSVVLAPQIATKLLQEEANYKEKA